MYTITQEQRDAIIRYLDNSNLPHNDVKALAKILLDLPKVEEKKEEEIA